MVKSDTVTLVQNLAGQQITGIFGGFDIVARRDTALWITGTSGLLRKVPLVNNLPGAPVLFDLPLAAATVSHCDGSFAGTSSGRIYRMAAGSFTLATTAPRAVSRVYSQGAVGSGGLFVERAYGAWRPAQTLGSGSYRYANFIRRPGGLGVEVLDSAWAYRVYTYRDSSCRIASIVPDLSATINAAPYIYDGKQLLDLTVLLDDPDSNFSDYSLRRITPFKDTADLKSNSSFAITAIPDSESCSVGKLKMASGRVRFSLSANAVTVRHDGVLGTSNLTCLTCYWKKYDLSVSESWRRGDTIVLNAGAQRLSIVNMETGSVSLRSASDPAKGGFSVRVRNSVLFFPSGVLYVELHDLAGRRLAVLPAAGTQSLVIPACDGVLVITCTYAGKATVRQKLLYFR